MNDFQKLFSDLRVFVESFRHRAGTVEIVHQLAPPISSTELDEIAKNCRLPIPLSLRNLWCTVTAECECTYWWDTPEAYHRAIEQIDPDWDASHIWGGVSLLGPQDVVFRANRSEPFEARQKIEFPKDARFWEYSLPIIPLGTGAYFGLYVRDNIIDPPVAYLSHECCGGSGVVAESLSEFLRLWQEIGFVGDWCFFGFLDRVTGRLNPHVVSPRRQLLNQVLAGEPSAEEDITPEPVPTETTWQDATFAWQLIEILEVLNCLEPRKARLLACAICRRVFKDMGECGWQAVELSEKFANGQASAEELAATRREIGELHRLHHREDLMYKAGYAAIDGNAGDAIWEINRHLDDPELETERAAQLELTRHIFGNPFQLDLNGSGLSRTARELADDVYHRGENVAALRDQLAQEGCRELADHFRLDHHPKGCWALDLILGYQNPKVEEANL